MSSAPGSSRIGPIAVAGLLAALITLAAGQPAERTPFKDLPPAAPEREVVRAVLELPLDRIRRGFTEREWNAEGFGGAWDRARRYFPDRTFLVRPGTYFMTHGFDADGRLFMEIHDSDYLELCAANRRTFTAGGIVDDYARMRGAAVGREAADFREKTGRLEPFFRDEAAQRVLSGALGRSVHSRLLEALREENYHMLAGGFVHEGMHAGIEDATVARLQAEFKAGERPVQWDELRAFMAESAYHGRFCRWAAGEISAWGSQIEAALRDLEPQRRRPDLAKFKRSRARCFAFAAFTRLRMRESWQSVQRIRALIAGFREDYVRGDPPAGVAGLLAAQDRDTSSFAEAYEKAVQAAELALCSLEDMLDLWTAWADGHRPFPPPVIDSMGIVKELQSVVWPSAPVEGSRALMDRAKEALETGRIL
jgi:hypothetical protein